MTDPRTTHESYHYETTRSQTYDLTTRHYLRHMATARQKGRRRMERTSRDHQHRTTCWICYCKAPRSTSHRTTAPCSQTCTSRLLLGTSHRAARFTQALFRLLQLRMLHCLRRNLPLRGLSRRSTSRPDITTRTIDGHHRRQYANYTSLVWHCLARQRILLQSRQRNSRTLRTTQTSL